METNPQIELAEKYVMETGVSIFLTGKAGTGKTTFLHHVKEHCNKRNVVLAPTGVAAVNAGGVTIHSFFQLPFCPYLPDVPELVTEYQMPDQRKGFRKSKIDIIRTLDLLIIDEISMVRADLLDAVDAVLRRYRRNSRPFGGVQLLMIGDVQQLAPVVTDDEKPYMDRVYPSPFFFHSKALQKVNYITIQLSKIYRQQDPTFVQLLNNIRDNQFDEATLRALNARVVKPSQDPRPQGAGTARPKEKAQEPILLTTHNYQADRVNRQRMEELRTTPFTLHAQIEGNFPETSFPTDKELTLKPGAQVMFVKNDSSGGHRYFNGKLGTVQDLQTQNDAEGKTEQAVVVVDEDGDTIRVTPEQWENIKYEIDPRDNTIKQVVDGTFTQYPLKTAWAITIHKAQGLTFDRVQVDAAAAFTYGQVYVALSRCRSLEGLTLLTPISARNAIGSTDIDHFNATLTPMEEAESKLGYYKAAYYYDVLFELFGFGAIQHDLEQLERLFQDHLRTTYPQNSSDLSQLAGTLSSQVSGVAERFRIQLSSISQMPEQQAAPLLAERIVKAVGYFLPQLEQIDAKVRPMLGVSVDNKEVSKRLKELAENWNASMGLKDALLRQVEKEGFDVARYQKTKVDFALQKPQRQRVQKDEEVYGNVSHPKLVKILTKWRATKAREEQLPAYTIIQQKSLLAIADKLPRDGKALLKIPGLGQAKVAKYGQEIVQMVEDYQEELAGAKEPKWRKAARLFAEGKSIEEVAGAMLRAVGTVEGYLYTAVESGELDADLVVSDEGQDEIIDYLLEHRDLTTLKDVYEHFNGKYSYLELRVARFQARDL